jgi:CheY-like chemotaxis protein
MLVDPVALAADVADLMAVRAGAKGLELRGVIESPVPTQVQTDPTRLRQILVNLVGNAIKFTELGWVSLSLGYDPGSAGLVVRIADTGIGMTREQLDHAFDVFGQADGSVTRRFGGSGLGLSISHRLAGLLGGEITATSQPGAGSEFVVRVRAPAVGDQRVPAGPLSVDRGAVRERMLTRAMPSPAALAGVRVLLAEDGPDNQKLISFLLTRHGAQVCTVANGRLAVDAFMHDGRPRSPLPYDLVLMDVQMPEMDGLAATAALRSMKIEVPIIALTAHAMPGDGERCLKVGCDMYATKPIDRGDLIELCTSIVNKKEGNRRTSSEV